MSIPSSSGPISRRAFIGGGAALLTTCLLGCSPPGAKQAAGDQAAATKAAPPPRQLAMTVYRDPSCGCCKAWAAIAQQAGYQVSLVDDPDMAAVKQRLGVPQDMASCHTAAIGGYTIEGHVPLETVNRLLRERPRGIKGLAVPGMPAGSPGMEMPDGSKEPFEVFAFDANGKMSVYRERAA